MIGRDMAGCLPFLALAIGCVVSAFILPALHGRGLGIWFRLSLLTGVLAIGLLAYARFPLYRQGKFLSLGPQELPQQRIPAYRWAWRLVVFTICLQVFLLVITRIIAQ